MLPAAAQLLVDLIGDGPALRLMQSHCGQTVEFPKGELGRGESAFAELAASVGEEAARILCDQFGGSRLYIPFCNKQVLSKRNQSIITAYTNGAGIDALVREYRLSDRQIWNILGKTAMTDNSQKPLF